MKAFFFPLLAAVLFLGDAARAQEAAPAPVPADAPAPVVLPADATPPPAPAAAAPAVPEAAPAPIPEEEPVAKAKAVAVPKAKFTLPAHDPMVPSLDYVGHRFNETNDSGGWGWVKLPKDDWRSARWVALMETPGVSSAPWRSTGTTRDADQNYEYRMHGFFAPFQVYDPHTNEMLDVFVLESFETIGAAPALSIASGPKDRHAAHMRSTFSSRNFHQDDF